MTVLSFRARPRESDEPVWSIVARRIAWLRSHGPLTIAFDRSRPAEEYDRAKRFLANAPAGATLNRQAEAIWEAIAEGVPHDLGYIDVLELTKRLVQAHVDATAIVETIIATDDGDVPW